MPMNLVIWFMEATRVISRRLGAANRRNIKRPSINYHMTSTKSLADAEKAATIRSVKTIWHAR